MVSEYDYWLFDLDGTVVDIEPSYPRSVFDEVGDRLAGTVANARAVLKRKRNEDDWHTQRLLNAHYYQNDAESKALLAGTEMPVPLEEGRWTIRLMEAIRDAARDDREREGRGGRRTERAVGRDGE